MACSTAKALEWDAEWSNNPDPSGRAALGVHVSAYDPVEPSIPVSKVPAEVINKKPRIVQVAAPGLTIMS